VLADRLPTVAALFAAGLISEVLVRAIEYRTALITDDEAIARVDVLLAEHVTAWGQLSAKKLEHAIDTIVDQVDPGALRRSRKTFCERDVVFGSPSDEAGFTSMWARLYGPDAAVLQQRVEEMARGVCADDPRTLGERRSEALTALPTGITQLACECGNTDCPAAARDATPPAAAVIHVVAHADTIDAAHTETGTPAPDPAPDADDDDPGPPAGADLEKLAPPSKPDADHPAAAAEAAGVPPAFCPAPVAESAAARPAFCPTPVAESASAPPAFCPAPPAFVVGGGVLPAPLLAAMLGRATVREIRHPGAAPPEPHYRPSRDLADFVRCRDLTCRWPGCDKPAYGCDVDHTVPYPIGPTHASNTKCYCRFHPPPKTVNHSRTRVNRCRARLKGARATRQAVPRQAGPVPRIVATAPCKVPASLYVNSRVPRSGTIRPFL
jgi:Domain of unknown function (DUF222)